MNIFGTSNMQWQTKAVRGPGRQRWYNTDFIFQISWYPHNDVQCGYITLVAIPGGTHQHQPQRRQHNSSIKPRLDDARTYMQATLHCGLLSDNEFSWSNKYSNVVKLARLALSKLGLNECFSYCNIVTLILEFCLSLLIY